MPDPRRRPLGTGARTLDPADAPERWRLTGSEEGVPEANWGHWVRLAQRILEVDALSREREGRGDAWDQGFAAGHAETSDAAGNPYR
ncbi:hypothetical protein [Microbacterium sp. Clip185]|uniref:hypothetical protein n=1 Tax=Microbacterium sp. Clip185 TaxID=3025663 RepID=UPI00236652FD|nr:hypothetical protein [Microbacterium sp. Clip185]WDG16826.1 hypothetical protein PQV94_09215 [Microbacterium sp. Clip185]